jgi:hypothetical protein
MYLPEPVVDQLFIIFNVQYYGPVDCAVINSSFEATFNFCGTEIVVSADELVVRDPRGGDTCYFGVLAAEGTDYLLSDTFLRSAYVVYDLDNREILSRMLLLLQSQPPPPPVPPRCRRVQLIHIAKHLRHQHRLLLLLLPALSLPRCR